VSEEHKSERFKCIAIKHGWKADVRTDLSVYETTKQFKDVIWNVYAIRGKETLKIVWNGDRFIQANYVYGDLRRKLWWPVEVSKVLAGRPDPRKYRRKDSEYIASYDEIVEQRSVPWQEDTPAIEIMMIVLRKEIRWIRKIDSQVCSAFVDVDLKEKGSAKHFRVYEHKNGRMLEWADALGFHTVCIDQIIDVA
jgi:hypothetical protein